VVVVNSGVVAVVAAVAGSRYLASFHILHAIEPRSEESCPYYLLIQACLEWQVSWECAARCRTLTALLRAASFAAEVTYEEVYERSVAEADEARYQVRTSIERYCCLIRLDGIGWRP